MIRKWIDSHHDWWNSFSSAFAGTLLGIGITFGITAYLQASHQREMAHKMLVLVCNEFKNQAISLENEGQNIIRKDSLFQVLEASYYKDEKVSKEVVKSFYTELRSVEVYAMNDFAEKIFSNNLEIMNVFDDLSIITDISSVYTLLESQKKFCEKARKIKENILNYNIRKGYESSDKIYEEFLEYQFEDEQMEEWFDEYSICALLVQHYGKMVRNIIEGIQVSLQITDEDLESLKSNRIKAESVHVSEKRTYGK